MNPSCLVWPLILFGLLLMIAVAGHGEWSE